MCDTKKATRGHHLYAIQSSQHILNPSVRPSIRDVNIVWNLKMKQNNVVLAFCWRCWGTTGTGEAALYYTRLIRMLLITSCMMCRESMNESEEIVHDSEFFSLNTLVSDLCPASLSLSVSASAFLSPKAVVPPTPAPPTSLSSIALSTGHRGRLWCVET